MGTPESKSLAKEGDVQVETIQETPFKLDSETAKKHAASAASRVRQRIALGMLDCSYRDVAERRAS